MRREYFPLPTRQLAHGASIRLLKDDDGQRTSVDAPALASMTDLAHVPAATIEPTSTIDEANGAMIGRGVRLLFVIGSGGAIVGLVTANDILGEKPMRIVQARGLHHHEILTEDVMTPADRLEVLDLADVRRARLGDIVVTLRASGRQHALVVEQVDGRSRVRGIFSATQIARNLGVALQTPAIYKTFAEIETVLLRG